MLRLFVVLAILFCASAEELRTAAGHPMQYYVSLPNGWNAGRKWPVVVVIDAAGREFQANLAVFAKARKDMPFVLVAPMVTTNGGANYRQAGTYRYSDAVWKQIEQDRCKFDMDGIAAVAADARKLFSGEDQYFLTAWEAGGHTLWAYLFQHPEGLRAVAASATNYAGRCLENGIPSVSSGGPAVTVFQVQSGRDVPPGKFVYVQSQEAMKVAAEHGFRNVSERVIADKPHGPLADEVLAWFASIRGGK